MVSLGNGSRVSGTLVVLVVVDLGDAEKFASGSCLLLLTYSFTKTQHNHLQKSPTKDFQQQKSARM